MNLAPLDIVVLILYFVAMGVVVWVVARRNRSTESYFLGDSGFSSWMIALTLLATIISSQTFIAGPADAFKTSYYRSAGQVLMPVGAVLVAIYFVPFFRSGFSSAYEYLSQRFNRSVCTYAAGVFLVAQIFRLSMVSYLIAILVQSVTGLPLMMCLVVIAGFTGIYTTFGGFSGVVWTDVIQSFILVLGAIVTLVIVSTSVSGGFPAIIEQAWQANKLSYAWDLNASTNQLEYVGWVPSLSEKSVTIMLMVGVISYLVGGLDQVNVQRWCAAKNLREARKAVLLFAVFCVPMWVLFMFLGTSMWVYFREFPATVPAEILAGERKAEEVFPYFILTHMPNGISGLVIAGALAAAMSSLSTSLNSGSMVWVRDFHSQFISKEDTDAHYLRVSRLTSWALTVVMILGALLVDALNTVSVADVLFVLTALITSTLGGIFLLGMLSRRATTSDVWIAVACALVYVIYSGLGRFGIIPETWKLPIHIYYAGIVGNLLILVLGFALSWCRRRPLLELKGLTLFTMEKDADS